MTNQLLLSDQMREVLELLDRQGPMTARQLNDHMHQLKVAGSRRVVAASVSRTVRRLRRRGLVSCEGSTIAITESGRSSLQEAMLTDLRKAVRQAVAQAWAEYEESQRATIEPRNDAGSERQASDHV
jgi:DNA-binding PadR family transcriptional regulator